MKKKDVCLQEHTKKDSLSTAWNANESCHTHEWVMSHTQMSHVTHTNESCHTHDWVMSHTRMSHVSNRRVSHVAHTQLSSLGLSHVTHYVCVCASCVCVCVCVSCHTLKARWSESESCHTHEWVMSHTWRPYPERSPTYPQKSPASTERALHALKRELFDMSHTWRPYQERSCRSMTCTAF